MSVVMIVFCPLWNMWHRWFLLSLVGLMMKVAPILHLALAAQGVSTGLSALLNDRTQGQDQIPEWVVTVLKMFGTFPSEWAALWRASGDAQIYTPVWVPQIPMSIGTVLLAICMWDQLIRLLVTGQTAIQRETVE